MEKEQKSKKVKNANQELLDVFIDDIGKDLEEENTEANVEANIDQNDENLSLFEYSVEEQKKNTKYQKNKMLKKGFIQKEKEDLINEVEFKKNVITKILKNICIILGVLIFTFLLFLILKFSKGNAKVLKAIKIFKNISSFISLILIIVLLEYSYRYKKKKSFFIAVDLFVISSYVFIAISEVEITLTRIIGGSLNIVYYIIFSITLLYYILSIIYVVFDEYFKIYLKDDII